MGLVGLYQGCTKASRGCVRDWCELQWWGCERERGVEGVPSSLHGVMEAVLTLGTINSNSSSATLPQAAGFSSRAAACCT
jgi:hypothetical protein